MKLILNTAAFILGAIAIGAMAGVTCYTAAKALAPLFQ